MSSITEDLEPLLQKAFFYLKFRPRTKKEVKHYLLKKVKTTHWSTDDVKKIIQHLEELDFINDKKFIETYVENRNILKPKGQRVLVQELIKLGIEKELIDEYFSKTEIDEEKMAFQILSQRWGRYKNLDKQKRFIKAASFLMRRGFGFDLIKQTINQLEEEN